MPTVQVDAQAFHQALGPCLGCPEFNIEEFENVLDRSCADFGAEYDGQDEETKRLRIEVAANRYDLLCIEGLVDAFQAFKDPTRAGFTEYQYSQPAQVTMTVDPSVCGIRPYVVGCIFRDVKFDDASFRSFIDLQDKLHQNLCRRRTLVAVGTHDLDKLQGPFTYRALPRKGGFKFTPLQVTEVQWTEQVDAETMFDKLRNTYLKPYLPIISESELTPVIFDNKNDVVSVPPIINADHCKLTKDTTNIFVEITSTDNRKSEIVLDQIVAFMGRKLRRPFTVEPIVVKYADGHPGYPLRRGRGKSLQAEELREVTVPRLNLEQFDVSVNYCRTLIGLPSLTADLICELLPKMMLKTVKVNEETVKVTCPITRRDILHPCDIVEDIAIAYGYNNLSKRSKSAISLQDINNLSERVRRACAMAGWKECLTFGLVALKDAFGDLRRKPAEESELSCPFWRETVRPCVLSDPKTKEFECVRPTLIPGILKTLATNQHAELPIRLFEIGDVVAADPSQDNRARQMRRVGALMAEYNRSCLEETHGLLDYLLRGLKLTAAYSPDADKASRLYRLQEVQDGAFVPGRCVEIQVFEKEREDEIIVIGIMGVLHPEALEAHGLTLPCSMFEVVLDPCLCWLQDTDVSAP